MPETTQQPDVTVAQAAATLGVSTRAVQLWIRAGKVKASRPDGVPATFPFTIPAAEVERVKREMTT